MHNKTKHFLNFRLTLAEYYGIKFYIGYRIQDTGYRIQNTEYGIQNEYGFGIMNRNMNIAIIIIIAEKMKLP